MFSIVFLHVGKKLSVFVGVEGTRSLFGSLGDASLKSLGSLDLDKSCM